MQQQEVPSDNNFSASYQSVEPQRKIPRYADLMAAPVENRDGDYSFGYAHSQPTIAPPTTVAAAAATSSSTLHANGNNNAAKDTYARQTSSNLSEESVYSSSSFTPAAVEPLFKPEDTSPLDEEPSYHNTAASYSVNTNSLTSSVSKPLSASDSDALAVLAGLADQSAKAPASWPHQESTHETEHYDYNGAEERRRAILNQYHSLHTSTEERSYSVYDRPSSYDGYRYTSVATAPENDSVGQTSANGGGGGGMSYYNYKPKTDDSR